MSRMLRILATFALTSALIVINADPTAAVTYKASLVTPAGFNGAFLFGISGDTIVGEGFIPPPTYGYNAFLRNNATNSDVILNSGADWSSVAYGLVRLPQGGGVFGYVVSPVLEPSSSVLVMMALAAGVFALKRIPLRRSRATNLQAIIGIATAVVFGIGIPGVPASAGAADFVLTATGPFDSATSQSFGFDGTTNVEGHLPSLYDAARLAGGSFTATYRFTTTDPPASGNIADYNFSPLQGLSYNLFDSNGVVVHVGGNSSANAATVFNNVDFAGTIRDTVNFVAFVNSVSGLKSPAALYQPQADFVAIQSFLGFTGAVTAGADFIQGLSLPIDPTVYLGFPDRTFRTTMSFNDGDTLDFLEPYQYVESSVQYRITGVTITAVPEPGSMAMLGLGLLSATSRRPAAKLSERLKRALRSHNLQQQLRA